MATQRASESLGGIQTLFTFYQCPKKCPSSGARRKKSLLAGRFFLSLTHTQNRKGNIVKENDKKDKEKGKEKKKENEKRQEM